MCIFQNGDNQSVIEANQTSPGKSESLVLKAMNSLPFKVLLDPSLLSYLLSYVYSVAYKCTLPSQTQS